MRLRKPVWTEGLFIAEHHLQQQDLYHEQLVEERLETLPLPPWGVSDLEVDADALVQGQFSVRRLRVVFPDGMAVHSTASAGALPPTRNINSVFGPNVALLPVYLAVPSQNAVRGNFGSEGTSTGRFVVEKGEVADFNSGGRPIALEWACPEVRILLGDESKQGMVVVQIAEIMRTQAGAYALRDTYIPPVMRVGASDFLQASLRRVASALATRSKALSATRRQRTEAHVEFDAGDVSKMLLLAAFNREAPYFAHLAATPETHPYEAFRALIRLTGELCTFVADADPTNFPKYNYLQLGDTFEPLVARALAHINTTVAERFVEIPLKRREDGMYLGKIQDSSLLTHEFFLAARGTLSDAEIHQKLPRLSKIASWNAIGGLLNQAVNGARIELEFRPSGALPVRPGVSFFRVQRTPEYWPDIQSTSTIAIYHPLPIEAIELSLYAVDPEKL